MKNSLLDSLFGDTVKEYVIPPHIYLILRKKFRRKLTIEKHSKLYTNDSGGRSLRWGRNPCNSCRLGRRNTLSKIYFRTFSEFFLYKYLHSTYILSPTESGHFVAIIPKKLQMFLVMAAQPIKRWSKKINNQKFLRQVIAAHFPMEDHGVSCKYYSVNESPRIEYWTNLFMPNKSCATCKNPVSGRIISSWLKNETRVFFHVECFPIENCVPFKLHNIYGTT